VVVILITAVVIDAANAHKDVEINVMLFDLLFLPKVKAHFPIFADMPLVPLMILSVAEEAGLN